MREKRVFLFQILKMPSWFGFIFIWVEPIDHLLAGTLSTCSSSLPTHQIIASHLSLSLSFRCVQANQPNLLLFLSGGLGLSFSSLPSSWLHQSMCAPSSGGRTKERPTPTKEAEKKKKQNRRARQIIPNLFFGVRQVERRSKKRTTPLLVYVDVTTREKSSHFSGVQRQLFKLPRLFVSSPLVKAPKKFKNFVFAPLSLSLSCVRVWKFQLALPNEITFTHTHTKQEEESPTPLPFGWPSFPK